MFTWAPVLVFLTAVMTFLVIPFGPGLVGQDLNIGLLYLFAVGGMSVVGLLLAGWSSFNKYSLLGGLRAAAQVVSYEIPLTLSVVGLILLAGTMSLNRSRRHQAGWFTNWFVFRQPLGALIFFIAATAEANRTPFDLTEADSEIVAGFATEYSGMRFGFLFFAEYVNVFIVSALLTTLFFGAWNAPIDINAILAASARRRSRSARPGLLGIGLLILLAGGAGRADAAVRRAVLPRQERDARLAGADPRASSCSTSWPSAPLFLLAYIGWDWVAGLVWFMVKAFAFVFVFVWMRGTFPRVRIDQLMGFAWKWLLPAALLNLFVTATAIVVVKSVRRSDELHPRHRPRPRHGPDPAAVLPAQGHHHVARGEGRRRAQVPRPPPAALRRVRHAQVRDLLPVRPGLPDRVHRHGRRGHQGPLPRPLGRARDLRRAARGVRAAAVRPPGGGPGVRPLRGASTWQPLDAILEAHDYDPKDMLAILEETQAEYGYLPVAALKHISRVTGAWYAMIYGTATYYRHLRFEPPAVEAAARRARRSASIEAGFRSALDASLGLRRRGEPLMSHLPRHAAATGRASSRGASRRSAADPSDLDAAVRAGAFEGLRTAVRDLGATGTIATIAASGLRGRGGAGFPTGEKWRAAASQRPDQRYVVANGYGADPAVHADAALLAADPWAVIEGLAIAAFAIGATEAILAVRADDPALVDACSRAPSLAAEEARLPGRRRPRLRSPRRR